MQNFENLVLLLQNGIDARNVVLRRFWVVEPLQLPGGEIDLVHTAAAEGQNGVKLFHHVYVIPAGKSRLAPACVFKTAGHVFLPVEIVWLETARAQRLLRVMEHLPDRLARWQRRPVLEQIRALFERQRVNRHIAGAKRENLRKRSGEFLRRVARKPRDEVHVDILEAHLARLMKRL